jgi:hypothetical protein
MAVSLRQRISIHESSHCVAAITFGIPILSVSLDPPNMHRGIYQAHAGAVEYLTVLCLAGPAGEELFCGPIEDGATWVPRHFPAVLGHRAQSQNPTCLRYFVTLYVTKQREGTNGSATAR